MLWRSLNTFGAQPKRRKSRGLRVLTARALSFMERWILPPLYARSMTLMERPEGSQVGAMKNAPTTASRSCAAWPSRRRSVTPAPLMSCSASSRRRLCISLGRVWRGGGGPSPGIFVLVASIWRLAFPGLAQAKSVGRAVGTNQALTRR